MSEKTDDKTLLQWHPAFFAGIQIEFRFEADKLIFENEHQLGTKPKEIDVLIIKKKPAEQIQKNIGRIFRTHNIIEYKSPTDYFSVDDFYKVYAYACLYKSDSSSEDIVAADEITLSFVCRKFPAKMIRHLQKVRGLSVTETEPGIYHIEGDPFGMQLIVTSALSDENNLWLHNLTNDLSNRQTIEKLLRSYELHKRENIYKSALNVIVRANHKLFGEVKHMCEALEELMKDELDAREQLGMERGIEEGMKKGIKEGMKEGIEKSMQQSIPALVEAYKELHLSGLEIIERLVSKLNIPESTARTYAEKYI